jgi:RHS repeat-associated protein
LSIAARNGSSQLSWRISASISFKFRIVDADGTRGNLVRFTNAENKTVTFVQAIAEIQAGGASTLLTGLGLDEVIARYTTAGARTYLTDALNTVLAQTREDQSVQNYYAYSPYGEVSPLGPDEGNSIQYTARENDQAGLYYYYRARYYDPVLKRFMNEDLIGLTAGINVYAYVRGNPLRYTDPLGLWYIDLNVTGAATGTLGSSGEEDLQRPWTAAVRKVSSPITS